jgi:hypothetical protein
LTSWTSASWTSISWASARRASTLAIQGLRRGGRSLDREGDLNRPGRQLGGSRDPVGVPARPWRRRAVASSEAPSRFGVERTGPVRPGPDWRASTADLERMRDPRFVRNLRTRLPPGRPMRLVAPLTREPADPGGRADAGTQNEIPVDWSHGGPPRLIRRTVSPLGPAARSTRTGTT